jgi:hypothetical protein
MQHVMQIETYGQGNGQIADKINKVLAKNPTWRVYRVFNIYVEKIGGKDSQLLVAFEDTPTIDPKPLVEACNQSMMDQGIAVAGGQGQ